MADFRLSERAASDLSGIADYTIQNFGIEQARRYRDGLVRSFRQLSDNPLLGRSTENLAPGLRRYEHGSHVIFYEVEQEGVLVVRILHQTMDVTRHDL